VVFAPLRDQVRFYGEPTGGGSTTYANAVPVTLSNGISVHVAGGTTEGLPEPIPFIAPDVAVPVTWADWSAGRDAVLDAALGP